MGPEHGISRRRHPIENTTLVCPGFADGLKSGSISSSFMRDLRVRVKARLDIVMTSAPSVVRSVLSAECFPCVRQRENHCTEQGKHLDGIPPCGSCWKAQKQHVTRHARGPDTRTQKNTPTWEKALHARPATGHHKHGLGQQHQTSNGDYQSRSVCCSHTPSGQQHTCMIGCAMSGSRSSPAMICVCFNRTPHQQKQE